jgi:hypothetical protein
MDEWTKKGSETYLEMAQTSMLLITTNSSFCYPATKHMKHKHIEQTCWCSFVLPTFVTKENGGWHIHNMNEITFMHETDHSHTY